MARNTLRRKTLRRKTQRRKTLRKRTLKKSLFKGGKKEVINYIISCHGGIVPWDPNHSYHIPRHFEIDFYGYQGDILSCTDISPQDICEGKLPTNEQGDYMQTLYPIQKLFGGLKTTMDYYLWPDDEGKFGEIFVCDGKKLTLTDIPIPETFSALLPKLKNHANTYFPDNKKVMVHCLFCRS